MRPERFAGVADVLAEKEGGKLLACAAVGGDGVFSGASEIADGFVFRARHMDGGEFAGAMKPGKGDGVSAVGFDTIS